MFWEVYIRIKYRGQFCNILNDLQSLLSTTILTSFCDFEAPVIIIKATELTLASLIMKMIQSLGNLLRQVDRICIGKNPKYCVNINKQMKLSFWKWMKKWNYK